jgi:hypothetical protein
MERQLQYKEKVDRNWRERLTPTERHFDRSEGLLPLNCERYDCLVLSVDRCKDVGKGVVDFEYINTLEVQQEVGVVLRHQCGAWWGDYF